jgi:hypothetical protein
VAEFELRPVASEFGPWIGARAPTIAGDRGDIGGEVQTTAIAPRSSDRETLTTRFQPLECHIRC